MEQSPEQVYTDLLSQLAKPAKTDPEVLAALFRDLERMHSMGRITDWQLQNAREAYARTPGSTLADAADWALDKVKEGLDTGADRLRGYSRTVVTDYTLRDPVRAILIAAGTGALLMALVALLARSGARKLRRRAQ